MIDGAQDRQVEEPLAVGQSVLIEFEVDEVAEPKALRSSDLLKLLDVHGSFSRTAEVIGASEAFVRQNILKRHRH